MERVKGPVLVGWGVPHSGAQLATGQGLKFLPSKPVILVLGQHVEEMKNSGDCDLGAFSAGRKQPKDESDSCGYPQKPGECRCQGGRGLSEEFCVTSVINWGAQRVPSSSGLGEMGPLVMNFYIELQIAFCEELVPGLGRWLEYRGLPGQAPLFPRWAYNPLSEFQSLQGSP